MSENLNVNEDAEGDERLDRLETDLENLKKSVTSSSLDMKKAVEELRKAVIDIRSAVSEIENPFNLLRVITNEEDLANASIRTSEPADKKLKIKKEETRSDNPETERSDKSKSMQGGKSEGKERLEAPPCSEEQVHGKEREEIVPSLEEKSIKVDEVGSEKPLQLSFKSGCSLLNWIYMMLDMGFDRESLKSIYRYCEYLGLVPDRSSIFVSEMIDAVVKAKSRGLSADDVILGIYFAGEAAGRRVKVDDVIGLIVKVLRRNKLERVEELVK